MADVNKVVATEPREYEVEIKVTYRERQVINPNGRGYHSDNVKHTNVGTALEVGFPAKSVESVIKRALAHLDTLKDD